MSLYAASEVNRHPTEKAPERASSVLAIVLINYLFLLYLRRHLISIEPGADGRAALLSGVR